MPWRNLLQAFMRDPRIVQKISESWPIRRAAQKAVAMFLKAEEKAKDIAQNNSELPNLNRFSQNFKRELKEGMKELPEQKPSDRNSRARTPDRKQGPRRSR